MKQIISFWVFLITLTASAQQYSGMSGLIQIPSAEMDNEGDARIGAHYLDKHALPDCSSFKLDDKLFNTWDVYLSVTAFWWLEIGYTMTFEKHYYPREDTTQKPKPMKDRYFSVKIAPIREGKYYPAVAVGKQDCMGSGLFTNYYIALTKHVNISNQELGANLVYRRYSKSYNHRWNGLIGGITYRPSFAKNWRAIVEWTGCDVNFGIDCKLFNHFILQASLQDGKYPSAGGCFTLNLF